MSSVEKQDEMTNLIVPIATQRAIVDFFMKGFSALPKDQWSKATSTALFTFNVLISA